MKHSTDRRTPQELNAESRAIVREMDRAQRYDRLAVNLWHESDPWPTASKAFFRGAMRTVHSGGDAPTEFPDGMAAFERALMADKLRRMASLRPVGV